MAIVSFADKETEEFFLTGRASKRAKWQSVKNIARRKLDMLHYAHQLIDLRSPPGNRLERLDGNLKGAHSIRINDQWRIVFRGTHKRKICDYH